MQLRPGVFIGAAILAGIVAGGIYALIAAGDDDSLPPADGDSTAPALERPQATPTPAPAVSDKPLIQDPHQQVAAVVSAHELATQAGMDVLAKGGTAADAAVSVAAALTVVEPWYSSALGGGTWALYYDVLNDEVTSLDGVAPTGSKATVAAYSPIAGQGGIHQAVTPGTWDGWMVWLERYGRLDLGDVLEPAITIAREGYAMGPDMAYWLSISAIFNRPETARIYAPEGRVLREGDIVYQHDLANTFEALVAAYDERRVEGRREAIQAARDYFYRGPLAEAIVQYSDAHGGYLTLEDFHNFEAQIVEPISIEYNDELTVYQNPPNSQGITMLLALNMLKEMGLSAYEAHDPDAVHMQVEAIKLAFADRFYHVGDPARVNVPVERLLSDEHGAAQRARIDMATAMRWPIASSLEVSQPMEPHQSDTGDTTTFHVVDRYGNGAAVTTSLGAQFLVVGDTGIHINNRMRFLALDEGNPNLLTPGYKVRHTSNPYMVFRDGRLYMLGGNTGADTQSQAQVQQFLNVVEFGMSAQEAVSQPRFVVRSFPSTIYPHGASNTLRMEGAFPEALVSALRSRGHAVERMEGDTFGNASLIVIHDDGTTAETGAEHRNGTSAGVVSPVERTGAEPP